MSERCVIYVRVSSEDQVAGTSLETQEQVCREYARREGLIVDLVFTDAGESAKSADRPQFQAMISYCSSRARRIGRVVVFKLDRFARDAADFGHYRRGLRAASGAQIVSATESITDDPSGRLFGTMLAGFAQFDNEVRAERTIRSMKQLQLAGYWTHQAPLGYVTAREGDKPVLRADPVAGPAIADVFHRVAVGAIGPAGAVAALKAAGVRSRSGRTVALARVHELLRDPIYCGRIVTKWTLGQQVRAAFAPLVSEETFDQVQLVLTGRARKAPVRQAPRAFPLRGFIRCGTCDTPMTAAVTTGRGGRRYGYYECHHRCPGSRGRVEDIERQWISALEQVKTTYEPVLRLFRAVVCDVMGHDLQATQAAAKAAAVEADRIERRAARLLDGFLDGTVTDEVYKQRSQQLQSDLLAARAASRVQGGPVDLTATLQCADRVLADPAGLWLQLDASSRQRFEVALYRDGLTWSAGGGLRNRGRGCTYDLLRTVRCELSAMAPPSGYTSHLLEIVKAFAPLLEVAA